MDGEVKRRIDEGYCALIGCAEHAAALAAEGLTEIEVKWLRTMVDALKEADARCAALEAASGDDERWRLGAVREALFEATGDALGRLRARAALAFRHDPTDARRRVFFSSYAPRSPRAGGGRRALCETVELKLR